MISFKISLGRCQRSHRSRHQHLSKRQKDPLVLIAFQTACIALIFLNATFIGNTLYCVWMENCFSHDNIFLIVIVIFSVVEIMNNLVSIKKVFDYYTMYAFTLDVFTLGVFYWQIHCLSKLFFGTNEQQTYKSLIFSFEKFVLSSWILIFFCYIAWNCLIRHKLSQKQYLHKNINDVEHIESELRNSTFIRSVQIIITLALIQYNDFICNLIPCTLVFILYTLHTIYRNKGQEFFDVLTK